MFAWCLLRVCHALCMLHYLLDVCSTFAWSCKRSIKCRNCRGASSSVRGTKLKLQNMSRFFSFPFSLHKPEAEVFFAMQNHQIFVVSHAFRRARRLWKAMPHTLLIINLPYPTPTLSFLPQLGAVSRESVGRWNDAGLGWVSKTDADDVTKHWRVKPD